MAPSMPLEDDEQPLETFLVSRFRGEKRFVCSFIWSSYCNPRDTSSATDISRRMCMIFTLIANAIFDTYPQYMRLRNHEYPAFAIWLVINALFFVACAFLLAVIGNVVGERVVLGMRVIRWHFDVFLYLFATAHVILLCLLASGHLYSGALGMRLNVASGIMWALLVVVASVACRERTDVKQSAMK